MMEALSEVQELIQKEGYDLSTCPDYKLQKVCDCCGTFYTEDNAPVEKEPTFTDTWVVRNLFCDCNGIETELKDAPEWSIDTPAEQWEAEKLRLILGKYESKVSYIEKKLQQYNTNV